MVNLSQYREAIHFARDVEHFCLRHLGVENLDDVQLSFRGLDVRAIEASLPQG